MARREFDWIKYNVTLPAPLARQMRWLTTTGAAVPEVAAEAPAVIEVELEVPDLRPYKTARDKAKVLLEAAAEVEHALMVQYLYATYSLKSQDDDGVTDAGQKAALNDGDGENPDTSGKSWPLTLRAIAREEMGHLMTVQNLLIFLGFPPYFERKSLPYDDELHPFPLKLQPLIRASLAKYVVAESPRDAEDIKDIIDLAIVKAGWINRVGVLYAMLGAVFAQLEQIGPGATDDPQWNAIVRTYCDLAYKQDGEPGHWHLPDGAFPPETTARQADPQDWNIGQEPPDHPAGQARVDLIKDRRTALDAIHFIGVQGEGPTTGDIPSHFERFLRIFRGDNQLGHPPFPDGSWMPTRPVPTDPKAEDFTNQRTRGWAELADARYALLLGFLYHYLFTAGDVRQILTGWIFAEMRSRLGFIARQLTLMPAKNPDTGDRATAAAPFTLPDDEAQRWRVHRDRTTKAIDLVQRLRGADAPDPLDAYLARLLASDQARFQTMQAMEEHAQPTLAPGFVRDIQPLFSQKTSTTCVTGTSWVTDG